VSQVGSPHMYRSGVLVFVIWSTKILLHLSYWLEQLSSYHILCCIGLLRFLYIIVVFCKSSLSFQLSYGCNDFLLHMCSIVLAI
jgi:hypothetical protein